MPHPIDRGHSSIKGNTDLLTILTRDKETDLLALKQEKHRGNPETTITIRADFASGEFEQTDSPVAEERRDDTADILELVESKPGMTANEIRKLIHKRPENVKPILRSNLGKLWRTDRTGRGGTDAYYPMSVVPASPVSPEHRECVNLGVPGVPPSIRGGPGTSDRQVGGEAECRGEQ